jgi:O-antigen ligase
VRRPLPVAVKRTAWQIALALFAFVQVIATFRGLVDRLYVAKWLAGVAIFACYFALGHYRISTAWRREFALFAAILAIGFLAQLGDALDLRAVELGVTYTLTAAAAFLVAPSAFRRRSVQRLVWPALLAGAGLGTVLGEYLGLRNPIAAIWRSGGRWRFAGVFLHPNAAGVAGLIGVVLAVAAFNATRRWRYLGLVVPFTLVMALADSRGSLLAAAALAGVPLAVAIGRWRTRRLALATCGALLLLLGLGVAYSGSIRVPETSRVSLNEASTDRLAVWSESLGYLGTPWQWLFGLGISRNISYVGRRTTVVAIPVRGSNTDNAYVDLLGRTGIVGLSLFLAMIASLTWRLGAGLRRAPPGESRDHAVGLAVLAATVALGMTNSLIFTWAWLQAMVAWPVAVGAATRWRHVAPLPP